MIEDPVKFCMAMEPQLLFVVIKQASIYFQGKLFVKDSLKLIPSTIPKAIRVKYLNYIVRAKSGYLCFNAEINTT